MIELTAEEKQRWKLHMEQYQNHSNKYNPKKSSAQRSQFLVDEYHRLGSISRVVTVHHVGRTTVHNALKFVKRMENEARTAIPPGVKNV